jgi:hypothetical protein
MTQNDASFPWTGRKAEAAALAAADDLTNEEQAARLGVARKTLDRWKAHPEFKARVAGLVAALEAAAADRGIARRLRRVQALQERWEKMQAVIAERAADPDLADAPGGRTGLVVRQEKVIGGGDNAERVTEYAVDVGLLKELRAHEQQAAQELGQWAEKREHTGAGGGEIVISVLGNAAPEDLR